MLHAQKLPFNIPKEISPEKLIREREYFFQTLFEQHDAIMLLIDPESGQIVNANNKAQQFYGYSKTELTRKKIQEINCLSDEEVAEDRFMALKEKRNFFTFEHKLSNDEIRLVEVHSTPITINDQTLLFSIIHDVATRKIAEDKIRDQTIFLNNIIDKSPIAMWISDPQGKVIRVNTSLLKTLNLSEQKVIGKYNVLKDQNLVKQKVMHKVETVFKEKVPASFEIWWEGSDTGLKGFGTAKSVWIDVSMTPIVDENNNLKNVICQWVNITDQKQSEEKIKSLSKFPDENPNPVLRFSKDGEILYASNSSTDLLKEWGKAIGESAPHDWESQIVNAFNSNATVEFESICCGRTYSFILTPIEEMGYVNAYGRDITEKRQIKKALLKNQERYEKAQEMGHVGNWEYNPVTKEFWGSEEAKRIYGLASNRASFTTEKVENCIPERKRVHQALVDLIEHQKEYDLVFEIITADKGIRKTIHSIAHAETDDQGNVRIVTGVITDISDQAKNQKALEESEKRYKTYIEQAPLGIFIVESNGKNIEANPNACKLLGYSQEELLRLSISDILANPEDINDFYKLKNTDRVDQEVVLRKSDGSLIDVRLVAVPIQNDQFIAFCLNISDLKKYTFELQEERDKAQRYLDIAEVMILMLDHNGEIALINQKGKQILGYDGENLIGWNWIETCIPANKKKEVKETFNKIIAGDIREYEYTENIIKTKSGEERIIAWHNTLLLGEKGKKIKTLSSGHDITELKIKEEKLRRSEAQYRSVIEDSPGLIARYSPDGTILFVNQQYCKFFGKSADQLIGEKITNLIPEKSREFEWSKIKSLTKDSPIQVSIIENINSEGDVRLLRWRNRALFSEEGHLIKYQSFGEDITEINRSKRFLDALNRAFIAMGAAQTHQEVFKIIQEELKQLSINCHLTQLDFTQNLASVNYLSYDSALINKVEKLINNNREDYHFSFAENDFIQKIIKEKRPLLIDDPEKIVNQVLPVNFRFLAKRIVKLLNVQKNIFAPLIVNEKVIGIFSIESNSLTIRDIPAATAFADQLSTTWNRINLLQDLRKTLDGTINIIVATVEARDPYTAGHQKRVADLAGKIAKEMGLSEDQIEGTIMAGVVHDLGKINIPAEILSKPGKISTIEYELIKTHPQTGYDMIRQIDFPWPIGKIILQHHERMDGSGYPFKLKGDEILIEARILAVADTIEAMASHRPYRPALGINQALDQIKNGRGKLYDPEVVDACLTIFQEGFEFDQTGTLLY